VISRKCREAADAMRQNDLVNSEKLHAEYPGCDCQCRYDLGEKAINQPLQYRDPESSSSQVSGRLLENSSQDISHEQQVHRHSQ
jgi:hypothetical protein